MTFTTEFSNSDAESSGCIKVRHEQQLRDRLRAGTSIGANLEEAHAGQSRADFIAKSRIALKEARETLYWLRLIGATAIVSTKRLEPLLQELREIVAILTTIVKNTTAARPR